MCSLLRVCQRRYWSRACLVGLEPALPLRWNDDAWFGNSVADDTIMRLTPVQKRLGTLCRLWGERDIHKPLGKTQLLSWNLDPSLLDEACYTMLTMNGWRSNCKGLTQVFRYRRCFKWEEAGVVEMRRRVASGKPLLSCGVNGPQLIVDSGAWGHLERIEFVTATEIRATLFASVQARRSNILVISRCTSGMIGTSMRGVTVTALQ